MLCSNYILKGFISQIKSLWARMCVHSQCQGHLAARSKNSEREATSLPLGTQSGSCFFPHSIGQKTATRPHLAPKRLRSIVLARRPDAQLQILCSWKGRKQCLPITRILLHSPCKSAFASIFSQVKVGNICLVVNTSTGGK